MVSNRSDSVVIVGAGVVGVACAHYLRQAGLRVTLVDQGKVSDACSRSNCGYICPSHVQPLTEPGAFGVALKSLFNAQSPFRVKPQLDVGLMHWMLQFARRCNHAQVLKAGRALQAILDASMKEYRQLVPELSAASQWQEIGLLYVLQTQRGMDEFARHDELTSRHFGVESKRFDGEELTELDSGFRPGLAGAFLYPGDASVSPEGLNRTWLESIQQRGVKIVEDCSVTGVRKETDRVVAIETSRGEFTADQFVFSMGAWSKKWAAALGCSIPVQPGKGYSVTMARPDHAPVYPTLFPEHKVGVSPFHDGLRLGSMMEFAGYDTSIPPKRIRQLRDSARPYLHCDVDGEAIDTWFGWRPMTWDSLPIIGLAGDLKNGYLATGHNMLGLSLAASTGRLISEMMTQRQPHIDPQPYSPNRF